MSCFLSKGSIHIESLHSKAHVWWIDLTEVNLSRENTTREFKEIIIRTATPNVFKVTSLKDSWSREIHQSSSLSLPYTVMSIQNSSFVYPRIIILWSYSHPKMKRRSCNLRPTCVYFIWRLILNPLYVSYFKFYEKLFLFFIRYIWHKWLCFKNSVKWLVHKFTPFVPLSMTKRSI